MRLLFLVETALSTRNFARFGVQAAVERGWDVVVLDLGDIVFPMLNHRRDHYREFKGFEIRAIASAAAFEREMDALHRADVVINLLQADAVTRKRWPILRTLTRSGTPYLIWNGPLVPGWTRNRMIDRIAGQPRQALQMVLGNDWINSLLYRLPARWLGVRSAEWLLESGSSEGRRNGLVGEATRRISAHAPDYDVYAAESAKNPVARDQALFLDQFLPFHPDFAASGTVSVEPEPYFAALRHYFDRIESKLGLEVVISAHPRADYSRNPDIFGPRKIVAGDTARLVLESRLVLSHATTSIGFAVMGRRPIVLLMTEGLWRVGMERFIYQGMADELGIPLHVIDRDEPDLRDILAIDRARYDAYDAKYLTPHGKPNRPLWQIAFDALEQNCRSGELAKGNFGC